MVMKVSLIFLSPPKVVRMASKTTKTFQPRPRDQR